MKNLTICPRCGNSEIGQNHNFCIICGMSLKEKVPTGAATPKVDTNQTTYSIQKNERKIK